MNDLIYNNLSCYIVKRTSLLKALTDLGLCVTQHERKPDKNSSWGRFKPMTLLLL